MHVACMHQRCGGKKCARSPLVLPCDLLAAQAASVLWRKWGFQGAQSVPEEPPAPGQVFLPKKCVTWANLLKNDPGALMDVSVVRLICVPQQCECDG
jgi:hypothetical protein